MPGGMESGGRSESIQNCLKSAQNNVVKVQNQLDQVVSTFGQSMQTGMQKCQADAQQLMASGGVEKGAYFKTNFAYMNSFWPVDLLFIFFKPASNSSFMAGQMYGS